MAGVGGVVRDHQPSVWLVSSAPQLPQKWPSESRPQTLLPWSIYLVCQYHLPWCLCPSTSHQRRWMLNRLIKRQEHPVVMHWMIWAYWVSRASYGPLYTTSVLVVCSNLFSNKTPRYLLVPFPLMQTGEVWHFIPPEVYHCLLCLRHIQLQVVLTTWMNVGLLFTSYLLSTALIIVVIRRISAGDMNQYCSES